MFASKDTLLTRPSGYTIARSVRLRSSASAYLNRTPTTTGSTQKLTFSAWVKRGSLTSYQHFGLTASSTTGRDAIRFSDTDTLQVFLDEASAAYLATTQVFRDPSAWYHIVVAVDTTQATSSNRIQIYVNGLQVTSFGTATYPSQNYNFTGWNVSGKAQNIGRSPQPAYYFDGYLTEVNMVDGQALTPSSFGETDSITGVWKAKKYSGTYGTNGFYLNFSDNSSNTATTIGKDYSGNGNNWTPNNISVTAGATYDSMVDSPTVSAVSSNYAVLNPLFAGTSSYLTNGNLNASVSATNTSLIGTIQIPTSGKWYWEYQITTIGGGSNPMGGIATTSASSPAVFYRTNGDKLVDGTGSAYGATYTTTDTIGVAVDVDGGTVAFYKNNTSQGNITYASSGFFPALRSSAGTDVFNINFGQRPFTYTPPTGFVALNTYNLPASTIKNGAAYMAATTYTGTGASNAVSNAVNGVSFQPDFVWIKDRSNARNNSLLNSITGTSNILFSDLTNAEQTGTPYLTSFNSNGFTAGPTYANVNGSGETYVGWQWKAGGTSSSNTNGSITSTVSVGATQGFSVVTYTGTGTAGTVGHGLGVAPSMIIVKSRSAAGTDWPVYHASLTSPASTIVLLNSTSASLTSPIIAANYWNGGTTSTTFGISTATGINTSSATYVAYCFAAVAGYSAFGSYTGNGSTDGPFVFLGFRPRFILVKSSSGAFDWHITDTSRSTYNQADTVLFPNSSAAESNGGGYYYDLLSNGFKCRNLGSATNGSGATYIFAAFAESPFKTSLAR